METREIKLIQTLNLELFFFPVSVAQEGFQQVDGDREDGGGIVFGGDLTQGLQVS